MIAVHDQPDSDAVADVMEPLVEGESSDWNTLPHGQMAAGLSAPDLAAEIEECRKILTAEFLPTTPYEHILLADMAQALAEFQLYRDLKVVDLQRCIDRSVLCWDDDRNVYIDKLGARLSKDPRVAGALKRSKQGVEWLLENWNGLRGVLETNGTWDDPQRRLAFDLLGIPLALRDGNPRLPAEADAATLAALVTTEVNRLKSRLETSLLAADAAVQAMAALGMAMEEDAITRRLRRCEAGPRRVFNAARAELLRSRAEASGATAGPCPASSSASSTSPKRDDRAPTERPVTSTAAANFLFQRWKQVYGSGAETAPAPEEPTAAPPPSVPAEVAPVIVAEPVVVPLTVAVPAVVAQPPACVVTNKSVTLSPPAPAPRNRQERRAQEKQARKDARRGD